MSPEGEEAVILKLEHWVTGESSAPSNIKVQLDFQTCPEDLVNIFFSILISYFHLLFLFLLSSKLVIVK